MREPAPWSLPGSSPGADAPGLDSPLGACAFHGATASEAAAFAREHLFIAFIAGGANSAGQAASTRLHNDRIGVAPAPLPELPPTTHIGGSRAMAAASDGHTARLVFLTTSSLPIRHGW